MSNRSYRSKLREERAIETRQRIRASARDLFATEGFAATTVAAIAEHAGVSPQTVYAVFGSKGGIIAGILEELEADADQDAWVTRIVAERDAHRQVRTFAGWIRTLFERSAPVLRATVVARADGDASRRAGTDRLAELLEAKGALREGVDATSAAERLWLLTNPEQYLYATDGLGWSPAAYEAWLGELLDRDVLEPG